MFSSRYVIFFGLVATCILWQLLLPGYVLTLDMIFTPEIHVGVATSGYYNAFPLGLMLSFFHLFLPMWAVQKLLLFALFFLMGLLSFEFLPVPRRESVRLFCALLYTVNPFVYSRFLAGHWTHLFAYALLPLFVHFLLGCTNSPSVKKSIQLFGTIFVISIFSLHFFVMSLLCTFLWVVFVFFEKQKHELFFFFKKIRIGIFALCGVSLYWIVPLLLHGTRFEQRFDIRHFEAFAPVGHGKVSTMLNILSLGGFWGEGQAWGKQFAWPQDHVFFWIALLVVWMVAGVGLVRGYKKVETRHKIVFFWIMGLCASIFATGAGDTLFQGLNVFLFEHVPFWEGFRDSQKFVGLLALCLGVLFGFGMDGLLEYLKQKETWKQDVFRWGMYATLLAFGFFLWGGFRGQLKSVWYPPEWNETKKILESFGPNEKVLFLPWHGYLSFGFNNNLLIANPAKSYFGSRAVVSRNIEIKNLYDQELDPDVLEIDKAVGGKDKKSVDEILNFFVSQNITHIVFFHDLERVDVFSYPFLESSRVQNVMERPELSLYEIHSP